MKLSEKQALVLFDIAKWSLCIVNENAGGYSLEQRSQVVNEILNQQSDALQDLESRSC